MNWTTKDKQAPKLRTLTEKMCERFAETRPTKTIGNHHYLRQRDLEQFMYDFALTVLAQATTFKEELSCATQEDTWEWCEKCPRKPGVLVYQKGMCPNHPQEDTH